MHALVHELAADDQVDYGSNHHEGEEPAKLGTAEVDGRKPAWKAPRAAFAAYTEQLAQRDQEQAGKERSRQDHDGEDIQVRVLIAAAYSTRQEKEPEDRGGGDEHH